MPRLENWAPNQMIMHMGSGRMAINGLVGKVFNDEKKRFEDGTVITTSLVMSINQDQTEARTMNTVYQLGAPAPEWVAFCREHEIDLGGYILEPLQEDAPTVH